MNTSDLQIFRFTHKNDQDTLIIYVNNVLDNKQYGRILNYLNNMNDFESGTSYYGQIRRLQKWYQEDGEYFSKSWKNKTHKRWISKKYDDQLKTIQNLIQSKSNEVLSYIDIDVEDNNFNSCLINKYRNNKDIIGHHRDTPSSFGDYPTICGLLLGSCRRIEFKRIYTIKKILVN